MNNSKLSKCVTYYEIYPLLKGNALYLKILGLNLDVEEHNYEIS